MRAQRRSLPHTFEDGGDQMIRLLHYNWQVRQDWFEWCAQREEGDLLAPRAGGWGGILRTLFHVVDVEHSWMCALQGKPVTDPCFEDYASLAKVRQFSADCHPVALEFTRNWTEQREHVELKVPWSDRVYWQGDVLRHVVAHEIHHIGQLSVWARQLGVPPVSANLIGRTL